MIALFALALALTSPDKAVPDTSLTELNAAFGDFRDESIDPVSDERLAAEAARYLSLTFELKGLAVPAPDGVHDLASLDEYFVAVRGVAAGHATDRRLLEEAIYGMGSATGYPCDFIDIGAQRQAVAAGPAGVGLSVGLVDAIPVIKAVAAKEPAEGLIFVDDKITKIDGKPTQGINLDTFVNDLRGEPNTIVTLTIVRAGQEATDVKLTRKILAVPKTTSRIEGQIGVILVPRLAPETVADVKGAVEDIRRQLGAPVGIVLDLRGNQGGLLSSAIGTADLFMTNGPIGSQRGRLPSDSEHYQAKRGDVAKRAPLVVLIDGDTAAGAEIIASALRDSGRAKLVGERTFGNGVIQTVLMIDDQTAVKLATGEYLTGAGKSFDKVGIVPDIEVPKTSAGPDAPLATAIALLAPQTDGSEHKEAK